MKLYLVDDKHQTLLDDYDLGDISMEVADKIFEVLWFLEHNRVTDRYKKIVLSNSCAIQHDAEGERELVYS